MSKRGPRWLQTNSAEIRARLEGGCVGGRRVCVSAHVGQLKRILDFQRCDC